MPTYIYQCKHCGHFEEVDHSMAECDNPSESLIKETSCDLMNGMCLDIWTSIKGLDVTPSDEEMRWQRIPQMPEIKGSYGGSSLSGKEKLSTIQGERKERSHKDFKKNIFPTLPKQEQKWFKNKKNGREY